MKTFLCLLCVSGLLMAAEPTREGGLSVHMLPDEVAKLGGGHGGFTVTDPARQLRAATYTQPAELLKYFQHLPATVRQNGIWIVTTDPDAYSQSELAKLKTLSALCRKADIPIYACRASELPKGWAPAQ